MTSQNACWKGRRLIDYFNIQYTKIINSHKLDGAKIQKKYIARLALPSARWLLSTPPHPQPGERPPTV